MAYVEEKLTKEAPIQSLSVTEKKNEQFDPYLQNDLEQDQISTSDQTANSSR